MTDDTLNENQAIKKIQTLLESQFPKTCFNCRLTYNSLTEFVELTEYLGDPIVYDVEVLQPTDKIHIGSATFANCTCGSTLSLTSQGIDPTLYEELLTWATRESFRRGMPMSHFLAYIRNEIIQKLLSSKGMEEDFTDKAK